MEKILPPPPPQPKPWAILAKGGTERPGEWGLGARGEGCSHETGGDDGVHSHVSLQRSVTSTEAVSLSWGLPVTNNGLMWSKKAQTSCINSGQLFWPTQLQSSLWDWLATSQSGFFACPIASFSPPTGVNSIGNPLLYTPCTSPESSSPGMWHSVPVV